MWQRIKALREERGQTLADMKSLLKKVEDEKRELTAEESTKFDELNTKAEARKLDIERYERTQSLEADLATKGGEQRVGREDLNTPEQQSEERAKEVRSQLTDYMRHGLLAPSESRALTVSGSGVVGDRAFYNSLVTSLKSWSGVREAGATVIPTTDGNDLTIPKADDSSNTGQIVGEAVQDDSEADASLSNVTLHAWKFDSKWLKVSIEMLQDANYNVEAFINQIAGERIGRAFNAYATTGSGVGQPKGFLTAGTLGKTAASTSAITYEEILDFVHSIDAGYRNSPSFRLMFHDSTMAAIRKLKDSSGQYIFAAGVSGAPGRVLDYAYVVNNDMPTLAGGTGSKVLAGGDFSRYFIRDVASPTIIRASELFSGAGLVGFRVFSRHDANLTDANAIKYLKLA